MLNQAYQKSAMNVNENSRRRIIGFLRVHDIKNDVAMGVRFVRDGLVRVALEAGEKRCGHSEEFKEVF